jgi:uracil DNA glycosylase
MDELKLAELFSGGGEEWLPILQPVIEAQPNAHAFIGPARQKSVVPVRELTFQALKPNAPADWKVVIFGQNPYPRVESATGIAMFDNSFTAWSDSRFGAVTSIRCIVKSACIWKHGVPKATPVSDIRALLDQHQVVPPPEWFQAMLTQGVLLLNAALTASSDGELSTAEHTKFWRPVIERTVEAILDAKQRTGDPRQKGVVFAWWGAHAKALRKLVEKLAQNYPGVTVAHLDHCNPAAQGDAFCNGDHFRDVNDALKAQGHDEVDWLPSFGWQKQRGETAQRMGSFIAATMELHKLYLERLGGAADETLEELSAIDGVMATPFMNLAEATQPIVSLHPALSGYVARALQYGLKNANQRLNAHEIGALYLYTLESVLYRQLNAALRHGDRSRVRPYFPYLRLFFSALAKLEPTSSSLWRGVQADLRGQYPEGKAVTWWGISSCTPKLEVARSFLGARGRRTLFEVVPRGAVSIRKFSAFDGEDEYLLAPGTRLSVVKVRQEADGLTVVKLEELAGQSQVS